VTFHGKPLGLRFSDRFGSAFPQLPPSALSALAQFETLVAEHASRRGLVGFAQENIADEIARSLLLAPLLIGGQVTDVGSGAGFPGVPLCVATTSETYLVDVRRKAVAFLELVVRQLNLTAEVINQPAERAAKGSLRERASSVVARALAPLPQALQLTAPLCRPGGRILITASPSERRVPPKELLSELGLSWVDTKPLYGPLDLVQHVHIIDKLEATSSRYPRRSGRAKRTWDRPDRKDAGSN
jgi:16S rRNA (guanine527-N7)-methyltransferase